MIHSLAARLLILCSLLSGLMIMASAGPRVLFVMGGSGTGGFLEGGDDDQLCDITDYSTRGGNHGWGELADWLREHDFELEQVAEGPVEANTPVPFADMDLTTTDVIVLGSNNADYDERHVDAIEDWVKAGGGLLVISDANFGQNWGDAPDSDQLFLDRFGWVMNQDQGTYGLQRSDDDFLVPSHPILDGVDSFDGEGVSPIMVTTEEVPGVLTTIVAKAQGTTRANNRYTQGTSRATTASDASLVTAEIGEGRVVGHFDRNTFFNRNGAGTDLHRLDNRIYALNLYRWLAYGGGGLEVTIGVPSVTTLTLSSSEEAVSFAASTTLFGNGLSIFSPASYQWALLDGPGEITFENENRGSASARFSAPGSYQIQVLASYRGRQAEQVIELTIQLGEEDPIKEAFGVSDPIPELAWLEGNTFQLTYPRVGGTNRSFFLEQSSDLKDWVLAPEAILDVSEADTVRFRLNPDTSSRFLRVGVE